MSKAFLLNGLLPAVLAAVLAWLSLVAAVHGVPMEERRWRDRPPLLWRVSWPFVRVIAAWLGPSVPPSLRASILSRLRQADLDRALDAEQWLAGCFVSSGAAVSVVIALSGLLALIRSHWTGTMPVGSLTATVIAAALFGGLMPLAWLRKRCALRLKQIHSALPFYLDVITLSVESGANLTGALQQAVAKGPKGPLRDEIDIVLRDVRAGRPRSEALRAMSERLCLSEVRSWVGALLSAEKHGSSLGLVLRLQSEQRRQERFQRAEKQAMKAPVKMLFPLLCFIFPCTLALLFFPVVVRLIEEGLLG